MQRQLTSRMTIMTQKIVIIARMYFLFSNTSRPKHSLHFSWTCSSSRISWTSLPRLFLPAFIAKSSSLSTTADFSFSGLTTKPLIRIKNIKISCPDFILRYWPTEKFLVLCKESKNLYFVFYIPLGLDINIHNIIAAADEFVKGTLSNKYNFWFYERSICLQPLNFLRLTSKYQIQITDTK